MQIVIKETDGCADRVKLDCSPVEWLIINKALHQFVAIDQIGKINHKNDVRKAESMLAVEPVIEEVSDADSD